MIAGYCWPQSVVGGETVHLLCAGADTQANVSVVRVGASEQVVLTMSGVDVSHQADTAPERWEACADIPVDSSWPSGFYRVDIGVDDKLTHAFFVVRAREPGDALLVLATSTYAAYNDWGAPSFYTGAVRSSLKRPLPAGFLAKQDPARHRIARFAEFTQADRQTFRDAGYSPWCMAAGWANWEQLFVAWAEAQGYALSFATSEDLERRPEILSGYSCYVSVGHDEYWSTGMRDAVEAFVDAGGGAAFFSGNTAFWQARFERGYSELVSYKMRFEEDPRFDASGAPLLSTMWSDPLVGRPEAEMTGVSFTRGGYAHLPNSPRGTGGYTVHLPEHWAFAGTAVELGTQLGASQIVVGYECDGCALTQTGGIPVAADGHMDVLATSPARLWETHQIPAQLDDSYVGELNWVATRLAGADTAENRALFDPGAAVMGSFRRGDGEVFTTGCTDWAYGLGDPAVDQVTNNVLRRFIGNGG